MNKYHVVRAPILNEEYAAWVVWGDDDAIEKYLRKWYENAPEVDYKHFRSNRGVCYHVTGYNPVIVIHTKEEFYGTLAHEAVHAINQIFEFIGDSSRGELFAHSVGAIVRAVTSYQKKHDKRKSKRTKSV